MSVIIITIFKSLNSVTNSDNVFRASFVLFLLISLTPPQTITRSSHFKDFGSYFTVLVISLICAPGFMKLVTL